MSDDGLSYAKTFSRRGAACLLIFAILAGCAAGPKAPAYLSDDTKARLGTVGVVSAHFVPRIELHTPAKGGLAGAGRRAASWAGKAAGTVVSTSPGCAGAGCGIILLAILLGSTVTGVVAGAISGAVDALPTDMVQEAEATLTQSLAELKLQEHLRERVVRVARSKSRPVRVLADAGPLSPDDRAGYDSAARHNIDSILEISVLTVGLTGAWDANPPLALTLRGRARLVRVRDRTEIHVAPMAYRSGVRTFADWAANDAQAFHEELDRALQYLAESVVEQTLLSTPAVPWPAELKLPWALAVAPNGTLFITDTGNHRIRKLDRATGVIITVAGTGERGFGGDGDLAVRAQLASPGGVAVTPNGTLFIADTGNDRIRKVEWNTGLIITVAGTGERGFGGDGDLAVRAQLASPGGVAVTPNGTLFIADTGNHRIRKLDSATGVITTVAGTGMPGFAGDGDIATGAQLRDPQAIAVDPHGSLLIVDKRNHCIREVEMNTGVITKVAGTGERGFGGDGDLAVRAQLASPGGVAVTPNGTLFIADTGNHRIRKLDSATGVITTVAGTGQSGFAGDGDAATQAQLASPVGVAVDANDDLFIGDTWNHRVRKVNPRTGTITTVVVGGAAPMGETGGEPTPATSPAVRASEGNPLTPN